MVAVGVGPAIGCGTGGRRRVGETDGAGVELSGIAGEAGAKNRLARFVDREGDSRARRHVVPGERAAKAAERKARHSVRECLVGERRARKRFAPLPIEADAKVDRGAAVRDSVADVEIEVVGAVAAIALAEHLGTEIGRRVLNAENHVSRPQRTGDRIGRAEPDAVLHVVRSTEPGKKAVDVGVEVLLRTHIQALVDRAVGCRGREVAAGLLTEAADRIEDEAGVVVRILRAQENVRRHHPIVGEFPQAVQRKVGITVVLVERGRWRVEQDAGDARAAAVLDLETVEVQAAHHIVLGRLPVHFHVRVLQLGTVDERAGAAHELDVLNRIRTIKPRLVFEDRTAKIEAIIRNLLVVIRGRVRHAGRAELVGHVVGLHRLVVEVAPQAALELVGAALDDEVQTHAAGRLLDILAGRRDLDLFEVVIVEIGRRRPGRGHVGDDDAVERPDGVLRTRALRRKVRLLSGLVAADVHAVDEDAGHRPHQRERIARGRDLGQLVRREVGGRAGRSRVDHRRLAGHRDRFRDRRHFERERQFDGATHGDNHVVAHHGGESLELGGDLVGAGRQIEEAVSAAGVGDERLGGVDTLNGDVDAGQHAALFVADGAADRPALNLRNRRRGAYEHQRGHQTPSFHFEYSFDKDVSRVSKLRKKQSCQPVQIRMRRL